MRSCLQNDNEADRRKRRRHTVSYVEEAIYYKTAERQNKSDRGATKSRSEAY